MVANGVTFEGRMNMLRFWSWDRAEIMVTKEGGRGFWVERGSSKGLGMAGTPIDPLDGSKYPGGRSSFWPLQFSLSYI